MLPGYLFFLVKAAFLLKLNVIYAPRFFVTYNCVFIVFYCNNKSQQ
jgi:hypothetical protein